MGLLDVLWLRYRRQERTAVTPLPVGSAHDQRVVDVRALGQTREVLAYQDGGLFPVLGATHDNLVVAVLRGGAGHMGLPGRIETTRSVDGGVTWSPAAVVADSERDDRNPAFGVSLSGTLIIAYHRQGNYDEHGIARPVPRDGSSPQAIEVQVIRSSDKGLTWDVPGSLGVELLSTASPYGKIVTSPDGSLLLPVYICDDSTEAVTLDELRERGHERDGSYVIRSTDDGCSWADPSLIAPAMGETALVALPGGELLAAMRGNDRAGCLWTSRSSDGGRTWTDPVQVTGAQKHPADLALLRNGDVLLTYGNRKRPYRIEGRISRDGGQSWLSGLLTFSGALYGYDIAEPRRTDFGYPSTVVLKQQNVRQCVTMYYENRSVLRSGAWQDEGTTGPLYRPDGYRAIALVWDEDELANAVSHWAS